MVPANLFARSGVSEGEGEQEIVGIKDTRTDSASGTYNKIDDLYIDLRATPSHMHTNNTCAHLRITSFLIHLCRPA